MAAASHKSGERKFGQMVRSFGYGSTQYMFQTRPK